MTVRSRAAAASLFCLVCAGCARRASRPDHAPSGILSGIGSVHHPIKTANPDAQEFFDQGLALTYGFNFPEALDSFRRASALDPSSPMPYWGIAWASGPNYNSWNPPASRRGASRAAIRSALDLSANSPQAERGYVQAAARCFITPPEADPKDAARECADAMREVYRASPNDPDAAVLFAEALMDINPWHLWTVGGRPGPDTEEAVGALETVLQKWPNHLGANHLYIHAMEGSPHPERALPSAHRLEVLAPAAGHLVHMPSHIYTRTGSYAEAVKANQRAVAADDAYEATRKGEMAAGAGYFHHNLMFLAASAIMDGEYAVAVDAASKVQAHAHSAAAAVVPAQVLLRFGRWDDVLALPEPVSAAPGIAYFWRFARASAFASKGMIAEAAKERQHMRDEFAELPDGRAFAMFFNDWSALDRIALDVLDARIAAARKDRSAAIRLWAQAAGLQDKLNFDDLPDWYYPVRESWGAALLADGRAPEAEEVFREDLRRNPRNPRSLFGLAAALDAERKAAEAAEVRRAFGAAWKGGRPPRLEDY